MKATRIVVSSTLVPSAEKGGAAGRSCYVPAVTGSTGRIPWRSTQSTATGPPFFYNPFRRVWVASVRIDDRVLVRSRAYVEDAEPEALIARMPSTNFDTPTVQAVPWCTSDRFDPHNPNEEYREIEPQLYNLDAALYESVMLG